MKPKPFFAKFLAINQLYRRSEIDLFGRNLVLRRLLAICFGLAVACSSPFGLTPAPLMAQEPVTTWTGGGSSSNWSDTGNWSGGNAGTYGELLFSGSTQTTNTVDTSYSQNILLWMGTSNWTLNNSGGAVISLYDYSGGQAKVENDSTGLVTINAPITFAATTGANFGEINAVNGNIVFGSGTLTVNGSALAGIKFWGASGHSTTFNNTVSASGKWFGLTGTTGQSVIIGSTGSVTTGDFYVMNSGTLQINGGGSLTAANIRLGGDFANTGNQNQALGGTFLLASSTGGQTFSSLINTVSGNTSGNLLINSTNTSGTNTISGNTYLDSALKIQNSAGGTLVISGTGDVKQQGLTFSPSGTIIYSGPLTSSSAAGGTLTVNGAGAVILSNTNNSYLGTAAGSQNAAGTVIASGTLGIYGDTSLGVAPAGAYNNINFTGNATLQDTANNITLAATRNISIGTGVTATFDTLANNLSIGGNINGAGSLTKIGTGTLTLTASNSFSGGVVIASGTIATGANGDQTVLSLLGSGTVRIGDSATGANAGLTLNAYPTYSNNITVDSGAGTRTITSASSLGGQIPTLSGTITLNNNLILAATGNGGLRVNGVINDGTNSYSLAIANAGTGTIRLNTTNTFDGGVTINQGTLEQNTAAAALGTGTLTIGGTSGSNNATLMAAGSGYTATNAITVAAGNSGTSSIMSTAGSSYVYSGPVALNNNLFLNENGSGSIKLSGTITGGSGTNSITNSGTSTGGVTLSGPIGNGTGTVAVVQNAASSTLTLSAANTYSGGTTISNGTLALTNATGAGTNTITVNSPGTLALNASTTADITYANTVAGAGNVQFLYSATGSHDIFLNNLGSFTGTIELSLGSGQANTGGKARLYNATLSGSSSLIIDAGTQLYMGGSGTSTFVNIQVSGTGNTENRGAIRAQIGVLAVTGAISLMDNTTIGTEGGTITGNITSGTSGTQTLTLGTTNSTGNITLSGTIGGGTGTIALTKTQAGTTTLTGSNTYTGATTISAGTLQLGNGGTTGSILNTSSFTNSGILSINRSDSITLASVLPSAIVNAGLGGSGGLTQAGSGTTTLDVANTYTGATTISTGALQLSNTNAVQNSIVSIGVVNGLTFNNTASGGSTYVLGGLSGSSNEALTDVSGSNVNLQIGNNNSTGMSYSGILSGSGSVTKIGTGSQTLSGVNTFSGGLTISSGTIAVSSNTFLGGTSGTGGAITLNGGALQMNLGSTGQTNTHTITVGASGGTIAVGLPTSGTPTYTLGSGLLIGSGTLTLSGVGTLGQAGANASVTVLASGASNASFTGNVAIQNGGILEFASATGIPTSGTFTVNNLGMLSNNSVTIAQNVIVNNGGYLAFQNNATGVFSGGITLNGTATTRLQNWWNGTVMSGAISGNMSGAGSLVVNAGSGSGGVLTLTGSNSYTGTTTIAAGSTIQLGNAGTAGSLSGSSSAAITDNGTLTINRTNAVTQGTDFSSSGITGSGAFIQLGSGITTLNVANTFTGSTTLTSGTLSVADTSYLGGATANNGITFNGGTLQVTGITMTGLGSHTPTYNASKTIGFDINNAANNFTLGSTAFASTDTLLKTGAGTLTLAAASNTITTLQLNQGTLDIGSNNLTINNAGNTTINDASTSGTTTINATGGGKIVLSQNNTTNGPDTGAANGATLIINARITGNSSFENWTGTNNGTGVTVLNGTNDYTSDTIINGGVLSVASIGNQGSTTSNLGQGTTIHFGTGSASTGTLLYTGTGETTNRVVDLIGTTAGGIIDASGSGLLKFTSNNTESGAGAKTLTLQGTGLGEFAGALSGTNGALAVTKTGSGAWTLSGSNSYTGQTTVSAGTLNYTGTLSSGAQINVGVAGGTNAVMNVLPGASITLNPNGTNLIEIGTGITNTTGQGFLYQSGGALVGSTGGTSPYTGLRLGDGASGGSYGYYNLSGGTATVNEIDIGGFNGAATGVLDMSGGTLTASTWLIASRTGGSGGIGILNLTGGTLNYTGIAGQFQNNWGSNGTAIFNIGNATLSAANADISLNQSNNSTNFGEINLLTGGTLQAHSIASSANGTKLVNFNGGTLKASTAITTFITTNNTAVNVFSGGGTIDNNGVNITIPVGLLAASGTGVSSVAISNAGSGYLGAPAVTFSGGGGGTGAAGYAVISSGTISSIVITNPGTGYTSAPTITLTGGGGSGAVLGTATLAANTSGGMTFQGTGTTILTAANTYTGNTTVNAGSTLQLGSAGTTGSLSTSSAITDNGTLAISRTNAVAQGTDFSGNAITGTGSLTMLSTGTLTLNAANTYTGATTISAGTLGVGNSSNLGGASADNSLVFDGGTLQVTGTAMTSFGSHTPTFNATKTVGLDINDASNTFTVSQALNQTTGGLSKAGAGTLSLSGVNTFTGNTTISAGTLSIDGAGQLNSGNYAGTVADAGTFIYNSSAAQTLSGVISGVGAVTKSSSGTLTLSTATNTFSGGLTINAGTVSVDNNLRLGGAGGTAGAVTLNGGTLATTAGITNSHAITVGANGGTINVTTTGQYYFNTTNTLLGSGTLFLTGNGTLTANTSNLRVDHTNTYSGNLVLQSGGIFEYGVASAIASSAPITINNQGELAVQNAVALPNNITVNGGTNSVLSFENGSTTTSGTFSGNITLNANATVGLRNWYANGTVIGGAITGNISGVGGLSVNSGSGTGGVLTLTNSNTYTGTTTINGAVVNLGSAEVAGTSGPLGNSAASNPGSILFGSGGTLQFSAVNTNDYSGRFSTAGSQSWNIDTNSQNVTFGTALQGASSSLSKIGSGTLTLTAANTYTGATTVSAGTLQYQGVTAMSGSSNLTVSNAGAITLLSNTTTTFTPAAMSNINTTFSGSGTINLGQISSGSNQTITLSGTTLMATTGTLTVNGSNGFILSLPAVLAQGDGATATFNPSSGTTLSVGTITGNATYSVINFTGAGTTNVTGAITQQVANRSDGLTFNQTGTVTLSGNSNLRNNSNVSDNVHTFVNVNSGTTNFNSNNAIYSDYAAPLNLNGGTIDNTSASAVTLAGSHAISIAADFTFGGTKDLNLGNQGTTLNGAAGSRTITTNGSATLTLSGAIANGSSTGLIKSGTGTLALTNANTFTGGVTINGGILNAGAADTGSGISATAGALGTGAGNVIFGGGTLQYSAASAGTDYSGRIKTSGSAISIDTNSQSVTYASALDSSNTGGLVKTGSGMLSLTASNAYTGPTTITSGTLRIGSGSTTGALSTSSAITDNAVLAFNRTNTVTQGTDFSGAAISGSGSLIQAGSGTLVLSSSNSYSGGTTISTGKIQLGNASALGSGTATLSGAGAVLDFNGNSIANALSLTASGTLTNSSASAVTLTGALNNGSSVSYNVNGTGNITFTGAVFGDNSNPANITVNGSNTVLFAPTSENTIDGFANITVTSGTAVLGATGNFVGFRSATVNGGVLMFDPNHTTTSVVENWAGQIQSGVTITSGTFDLNGTGGQNDTMVWIQGAGGVLTNSSTNIATLSLSQRNNGAFTLASTISGAINLNTSVSYSGGNTEILTGNNTAWIGTANLTSGTMVLGNQNAMQNIAVVLNTTNGIGFSNALRSGSTYTIGSLAGSSNLALSDTSSSAVALTVGGNNGNTTYSGTLSGAGSSLIKSGNGTLTLSGSNSYTGGTTIKNGTISQSNVNALGTGTVTLGDGSTSNNATLSGTLASSGTVANAITVASGGTGTYTIANNAGTDYTLSGNVALNNALKLQTNANCAMFFSGTFTGSSNITVDGGASNTKFVDFSGNNASTWAGDLFITNKGYFKTDNANAVSVANLVTMDSTSTFDNGGNSITIEGLNDGTITTGTASVILAGGSNKILTLGGAGNYSFSGSISSSGGLAKSGSGTQTLSGSSSYSGGTTLTSGTLVAGDDNALGSGLMTLDGGSLRSNNDARSLLNPITVTGSGGTVSGDTDLAFMGTAGGSGTLTVNMNSSKKLTVNPAGANSFAPDTIQVSSGTLLLGGANKIGDSTKINLNGGTFNTGGNSEGTTGAAGLGTLTLSADSSIDLGSSGILHFADSSSQSWSGSLSILNWAGSAGGGGANQILFGLSSSGLSSGQLGQITFSNPSGFAAGNYSAAILGNGELVPVPEPATIIGALAFVGLIVLRERRRFQALLNHIRTRQ